MPKGCFYFTEINDVIQFPLFQPSKPQEYKPHIETQEKPKKKIGLGMRYLQFLNNTFNHVEPEKDSIEENIHEDEKGDFLMLQDESLIFSEEDKEED